MKNDKQNELLRLLARSDRGVPAATLASMLGISERTVRNYIRELNGRGGPQIVSTREGYRLDEGAPLPQESSSENDARLWQVLSHLLTNKEGMDVYDMADSLHVSASTVINTVLPQIKEMIRSYDLHIESQKYRYTLKGSEQNKRRLIGRIATQDVYGFFSSKRALEQLFPNLDIRGVMQKLYDTCLQARLFLNDYSLNNLLVHILVILIRVESNDDLTEKETPVSACDLSGIANRDEIVALADMITETFARDYGIRIPGPDYQQILMLIALSVEHETVDIQSVIDPEFINNVTAVLAALAKRYCTPVFTNDFALQFSVHMYYAYQRSILGISYPNPIAGQFKADYAPVYDMAVYFVHKFSNIYHIELNEDEIAFVAFHIGSYIESSAQATERITCIVLAENYHTLSQTMVREISRAFSDRLIIMDVMPLNRYLQQHPDCDFVITALPLEHESRPVVRVSPILTKQNMTAIGDMLNEIDQRRELEIARAFLKQLLHKELYFRNVPVEDEAACIQFMGRRCVEQGYVTDAFVQDVLLRESLSCTAFTSALAVPHALSQYADRSFICVLHNDMPIAWKNKRIHFVLMIGITQQEMKYFKDAFNLIVELFGSTSRTLDLLKTDSFEEFCAQMY